MYHVAKKLSIRRHNRLKTIGTFSFLCLLVVYGVTFVFIYLFVFKGKYLLVQTNNKDTFQHENVFLQDDINFPIHGGNYEVLLPWWESVECDDTKSQFINSKSLPIVESHCSIRASHLGPGQKVVSFCLYGNYSEYGVGLEDILQRVKILYPNWMVRVYTEPDMYKKHLCPLLVKYNHFHICDVNNLPGDQNDLTVVDPRLWRVAPLGDPLVDVFLSRDIDSLLLRRETHAIKEFLETGHSLHTMRDHPDHGVPIMAGTFAVRQDTKSLRVTMNNIRNNVFQRGLKTKNLSRYSFDQIILEVRF